MEKLNIYIYTHVYSVGQLCPTLCNPMDCSPPGSFVHGILQARILTGMGCDLGGSSQPRYQTRVSCIFLHWQVDSLPLNHLGSSVCMGESSVIQSCLTLCDPMDCSSPGSSVHGTFKARILEWVAISFSRGSSPGIEPASPALACRFFTI